MSSTGDTVSYASAASLLTLSEFIGRMSELSNQFGWHVPGGMVVALGDKEEEIVVGVRWVGDEYVAEIR